MEKETRQLFIRFLNNQCSVEEQRTVNRLLENEEMMQLLYQLMQENDDIAEQNSQQPDDDLVAKKLTWQLRINRRIAANGRKPGRIWNMRNLSWVRYAAVFIGAMVIIGISVQLIRQSNVKDMPIATSYKGDILPGSDKALLTLSDGRIISLSDTENGTIVQQEGAIVEKTADGEIVYSTEKGNALANVHNSVVTPKGGQYRITLPDGTKAWLNAASSLTYPVQFTSTERRVQMTGEVYFEVVKLPLKTRKGNVPFIVEMDKQEIEVLGTEFNVNAYSDEPHVRTTLIEGSVRITAFASGQTDILKPGQQSLVGNGLKIEKADIRQQLAWRKGDFIFQGESLESILRNVSRWYDVEVECPEHLAELRFNGMVSRSKPLSDIIDIIEATNKVHFTLEGRRLTVKD